MKRSVIIILLLTVPALIFSQEQQSQQPSQQQAQQNQESKRKPSPVVSQYSHDFVVKDISFNKRIDVGGRGELLEVEFNLVNKTDYPFDVYIFVLASYEVKEKTDSSFEPPVPREKRIRSFVPFPDVPDQFRTPILDDKGNIRKNVHGVDMYDYEKSPRDPKTGVNPDTGKPYTLKEKMLVRTYHLSLYRNNYFFFNQAAILIFDKDGNPVFRQLYELNAWRR